MASQDFQIMPCVSLTPSKLVCYNRIFRNSSYDENGNKVKKSRNLLSRFLKDSSSSNSINRSSHNLVLSDNAYRTLKRKIEWLYYLSKSRYIKTYSGKEIFNYKMSFITLTLSSQQKHCTKEVTSLLFNTFITEVKQRTKMDNYVWRLEFQKNGNVHYHIATDCYLDYYLCQKIWNRIQANHGYIEDYYNKFSKMSLTDYFKYYQSFSKKEFNVVAKIYAKNKSANWSNPPSVDVKSVQSKKAIANYISKYFSKDASNSVLKNKLDNEENSSNMRLWFCSRSLSRLKTVNGFVEEIYQDFESIIKNAKDCYRILLRYATVYLFELKKLSHWSRSEIEKILRNYAYGLEYKPAS